MKFNKFDNSVFGMYDVMLHTTFEEAEKIMKTYNCDILPDCVPVSISKANLDLYMFLIDSKENIITPLWNFNYAYGCQYNTYLPVHEEIEAFDLDLSKYNFVYFTKRDIETNRNKDREFWVDNRPIFRDKK